MYNVTYHCKRGRSIGLDDAKGKPSVNGDSRGTTTTDLKSGNRSARRFDYFYSNPTTFTGNRE